MNFYALGQQEAFAKFAVEYRGKTFPGYNQPIASDQPDKKKMVLAKKGDTVKLIHFGHSNYKHNYSDAAKKNYLTRSAGIKDKDGNLTKDNKLSANYWARRVLWPKGEADGSAKESEEKPWDKKNPKKESKPLSSDQKSEAKRRAQAAGRPYPNLVDNMNAAKRR